MDIKEYIEKQKKNLHKDILSDICLLLHNCAECRECNPSEILYREVQKATQSCFYIEPYDSKTNIKLLDIAKKHNYHAGFVNWKDGMMIKFWR